MLSVSFGLQAWRLLEGDVATTQQAKQVREI